MLVNTLFGALLAAGAAKAQLDVLAKRAGLEYFGSALGEGSINSDTQYRNILANNQEFGQVVPENGMKWESVQRTQGTFNYQQGDISANFARQNNQLLRCHALVWHSQLPTWVSQGSWSRQTLTQVIETHINNVMTHYRGQCYHWDVVNEAADDSGAVRDSIFSRTFGTDFLAISFRAARAADPSAKLYYNDYNLEYNGAKTDRVVEFVRTIQAAGAPIDGVGFQGHLIVGSTPSRANLATALRRFTALGVEVAYTEIDIRHSSMPPSQSALVTQGNDFANVVGSCLDVDGCVGITIWGYTDKYSWVPSTFSGAGAALLYDQNFSKKPAWTSVSSVLAAAATGGPPAVTTTSIRPVTTTPTTSTPAPTTIRTTTTTTPPIPTGTGPEQTRWGQCGGIGWTGPTRCQSPWTCTRQNDWYSQCL
ncbi:glycoside hydrolase superfamily [Plectosphaerella cucumerina]|uniref:Beta-xylanase n=1 Tax=Plectosphaerella cucumerina TaxID=40658 RepID=A0A8K0X6J8_9PEZI|nr:glycoside hydrolase superfamily [Plectosphaerella cucumerina]